jgi:hypothetical protein
MLWIGFANNRGHDSPQPVGHRARLHPAIPLIFRALLPPNPGGLQYWLTKQQIACIAEMPPPVA